MRSLLRFRTSPALVAGVAAIFLALAGSALALGTGAFGAAAARPQLQCRTGAVRGIALVTGDPKHGIQNMPGQFTGQARFFGRKFNCAGGGVQARRLGAGSYAVRFPGLASATAVASPLSADAAGASIQPLPDGSFQISLRGTKTFQNQLPPVDVAFVVVVF